MKEVDDVLGGAAAWENVDSCDEKVQIVLFRWTKYIYPTYDNVLV